MEYKQGEMLVSACGSPCYAAPEMIAGKRYHGIQTDIWSSGVTLYAMLVGFLPFEDPNIGLLFKKILLGQFEIPNHLSANAVHLLNLILNTDPNGRGTMA